MKLPWEGLSAQARRALLCHSLYWQAAAIGSTFVNLYVYRLSDGFASPAFFQLVVNASIPVGFALGSWGARRLSGALTYRLGLLANAGFLAFLLLLGERSLEHLVALGASLGLAAGVYWQAWNLMLFDLSDDASREAMLGTQQVGYFLSGLIAVPLTGLYLSTAESLDAYLRVFAVAAALYAAAGWLSLPLKGKPLHGAGAALRLLRIRKSRAWKAVNLSAAILGFSSVSSLFLAYLVAYEASGSERGTGNYAWVNALCGVAAAWWVGRSLLPSNRLRTVWLASLAIAVVTLPLAFDRSFSLVLLYGAGMAVSQSLFNIPITATYYKVIGQSPRFHHRRPDTLTIREIYINAGRVAGYAFIVFLVAGLESSYLGLFFVATALAPILNAWVVRRYV